MAAVGEREASGEGLSHGSLLEPGGQDTIFTAASHGPAAQLRFASVPFPGSSKALCGCTEGHLCPNFGASEVPVGDCHGTACEGRYKVRQLQII